MQIKEINKLKNEIEQILNENKALEVKSIDLKGKTSVADFMIVASGNSSRHIHALSEILLEKLKKKGLNDCHLEGRNSKDWKLIESFIKPKSKVLDIGCGEGGLIKQLEKNINVEPRGLEIDPELTRIAISEGLKVIQGNAETDLNQYSNQSFNYVILSQTLQAMLKPKDVLNELLRIGSKAIVSFPNFGLWKIRLQLMLKGQMPITKGLPYSWYETPNIHFFTIKDFQQLCKSSNIIIEKSIGLTSKGKQFNIYKNTFGANLITSEAIFLLSYKNYAPIKIRSKQKTFSRSTIIAS